MLIDCCGITIKQYYVPPFKLYNGEIIVIFLYGGAHFDELKQNLADILIGTVEHSAVKVYCPLTNINFRNFQLVDLPEKQNIVFDLIGIGPDEAISIYSAVKENTSRGGSAILLDWTKDMEHDCTKFLEIELLNHP